MTRVYWILTMLATGGVALGAVAADNWRIFVLAAIACKVCWTKLGEINDAD
jgi:hypothetical protein